MESQNVRPVLKLFEWATSQWSIMDSVLKALGLIHLNIIERTESTRGHHNATQRAHYASERDHLNARLLKPEAVCEFLAVLRFLRNLRKSGGGLDSPRALIVPSSLSFSFSCILLQLQPFDMDDDGDHHNEEDVDDDKKLCLLQNKNTGGISLARWSRCGAFLFLLAPI